MHRTRLWRRGGLAVAFVALGGLAISGAAVLRSDAAASAAVCPTGYALVADKEAAEHRAGIREVESLHAEVLANTTCINEAKHPEKVIELILRQEGLESVRSAPYDKPAPGAYGAALAESKKLPKASATTGTSGKWESFGKGPLQVDHPDYERVNGLGLVDNMGRLDSLAYDPVGKRLFAAKGTGGIWQSDNLGDSWKLDRRQPSEPDRRRGRLVLGGRRHARSRSAVTAPTAPVDTPVTAPSTAPTWARPGRRRRASRTEPSGSRSRSTRPTRSRSTPVRHTGCSGRSTAARPTRT